jgi:5-methylcytosine-specific restriction endonuclease McrA
MDHIAAGRLCVLESRLHATWFNQPVFEDYGEVGAYLSLYHHTRRTSSRVSDTFCHRAVDFFTDVITAIPRLMTTTLTRETYPKENRKKAQLHLRRERSGLLARDCKLRDKYRCRVCLFKFSDVYGKLGQGFAEAHHLKPLAELRESVATRLPDLRPVCANCHRMLHRLESGPTGFNELRRRVGRHIKGKEH